MVQVKMRRTSSVNYPLSLGYLARIQRCRRHLSQAELAEKVGVSLRDVNLLENNYPLRMEVKHKMLKGLWEGKANIIPR